MNTDEQNKLLEELASLKVKLQEEKYKRKKLESQIKSFESSFQSEETPNLNKEGIFRAMIQNSADIITLISQTGDVKYVSSSVIDVLGYTVNELLNRNVFEFIHPDDLNLMKSELTQTLKKLGRGKKMECRFLSKKGTYLHLEAQGNNQSSNPSIEGIILSSRDISKRKISEEELKNSEEQKKAILSSITEAFIALDTDWNVTYINKRANVLFNRSNRKILGENFWSTFADITENGEKYFGASTKNKHTEFEYFYERLQKWLSVKIYPSKKGLSIFYTDITESKIDRTIIEIEQNALIENTKRSKKLNEIVDEAILKMGTVIPGMICSVMMVSEDGKSLLNFSAPLISKEYLHKTQGLPIKDNFGSCSTAALTKESVITSNIKKDVKWLEIKDITEKEGFISCWSFPIISTKNEVLAIFAVYFKKETVPSKIDLSFISKIRRILSSLIEDRKKEDEINKLSLIAKNTNKAVFITDLDQCITWVNPAFTDMTGYNFSDVIGEKPIQLLEGAKSDFDTMRYLEKQMKENGTFTLNTIFHKKNGEIYWSRITGQPMYDETGNTNQYFAIQEDTTARKLAKIDLQDSEKRYRALFHSNSQPMYIYDKSTLKFIEVNEAAVNAYGYSTDEFNEMKTYDLLEDELKKHYNPNDEKVNHRNNILNSTEILTDQSINKTKDGRLIHVEIIRNEMIISGKASILAIVNDVTKKLNTEKKLIQSNERFTLASKAVNEAIWDLNIKSHKLYWANGVTQLFGYENPNEVLTAPNWHTFVHEEDYQPVKQDFDRALADKNTDYWDSEYRFLKQDGTYAFILDRAFIVRNPDGQPTRVIGAMQDITKQKNFENQKLMLISETQEYERKRFSMELHDGLAQHLVALKLYLSQIEENEVVEQNTLKSCFDILKISMNQTRALCYSLTPPELDHGFLLALEAMFERLKSVKAFDVQLNINSAISDCDFGDIDKYNLYRIIQEFVNNSIKHSKGSLISCVITKKKKEIKILVKDNGNGFDMSLKSNSLGLKNIEQRAHIAKINYELISTIGDGTQLLVTLH